MVDPDKINSVTFLFLIILLLLFPYYKFSNVDILSQFHSITIQSVQEEMQNLIDVTSCLIQIFVLCQYQQYRMSLVHEALWQMLLRKEVLKSFIYSLNEYFLYNFPRLLIFCMRQLICQNLQVFLIHKIWSIPLQQFFTSLEDFLREMLRLSLNFLPLHL